MNKIIYYILQFTYGLLTNIIGLLVFIFVFIFKKPIFIKTGNTYMISFGKNWGGLSLGIFLFCDNSNDNNLKFYRQHEYGHSIQNIIFGPMYLFIIGIPSICRYIYYNNHIDKLQSDWYYNVWFEEQATNLGYKYLNN